MRAGRADRSEDDSEQPRSPLRNSSRWLQACRPSGPAGSRPGVRHSKTCDSPGHPSGSPPPPPVASPTAPARCRYRPPRSHAACGRSPCCQPPAARRPGSSAGPGHRDLRPVPGPPQPRRDDESTGGASARATAEPPPGLDHAAQDCHKRPASRPGPARAESPVATHPATGPDPPRPLPGSAVGPHPRDQPAGS